MGSKYIMRLDDACERRNLEKWNRIEELLSKYGVKPLVGIIPHCEDKMMSEFLCDAYFWDTVLKWEKKEWCIAMHGYNHVYISQDKGINPVNSISEFAGVPLDTQCMKIREGVRIFREHGIEPKVFFAPAHTMDLNTIRALKQESEIRIVSDTIANDSYNKWGITFVPQQSGRVRKLPFKVVTFCYHPNVMTDDDIQYLEEFIQKNREQFISFPMTKSNRHMTVYDKFLQKLYFGGRKKRE